jgi:hypothetical protein
MSLISIGLSCVTAGRLYEFDAFGQRRVQLGVTTRAAPY